MAVHTSDPEAVEKVTEEGVKISERAHEAGVLALKERDFRRKGLGVSLILIIFTILGLYLRIRQIEAPPVA